MCSVTVGGISYCFTCKEQVWKLARASAIEQGTEWCGVGGDSKVFLRTHIITTVYALSSFDRSAFPLAFASA